MSIELSREIQLNNPQWIERANQYLQRIALYEAAIQRPPSKDDIEWNDAMIQQWNIYDLNWKLNPTGRFSQRFIKESYPGGIGDGYV